MRSFFVRWPQSIRSAADGGDHLRRRRQRRELEAVHREALPRDRQKPERVPHPRNLLRLARVHQLRHGEELAK